MAIFMQICPEKRCRKGDVIFYAGDPATDLHIIVAGQVKLVSQAMSGSERILAICGRDDFIGEAFLVEEERYRVDAVALTETMTCPVSRKQFLQVSRQAPGFALSFAEILASRLFHCRQQLSDAFDPVKVRLAKSLLDMASRFGKPQEDGDWFDLQLDLKHEELASLVSATRVSVTMAFTELRGEGLVKGSRGHYLLNIPALALLSNTSP
jgi:CRP-like cAMP-binding protein